MDLRYIPFSIPVGEVQPPLSHGLISGVAGSGKTLLAQHIQLWLFSVTNPTYDTIIHTQQETQQKGTNIGNQSIASSRNP